MITLDEVLQEIQNNKRVCPQPIKWKELYEMLPNKKRKDNGWDPPLPLILAAWWNTPALLKMHRLKEHIEWASREGCLEKVYNFLLSLDEKDWYHLGD
jgi:phosphoserine aminotransferase